jgi:uncharacterized ParB-like nuclease family protein
MRMPIKSIRRDLQHPDSLISGKVREIAAALERGEGLPPVIVRRDGENYWLQDGFHRVEAALSLGREEIDAEILLGTPADACQPLVLNAVAGLPIGVLAGMITNPRPANAQRGIWDELPADAGWFTRKLFAERRELLQHFKTAK